MANPEHLEILKQGVEGWNEWRNQHPEVLPELSEADLRTLNLIGANLRGADVQGARLSGMHLDDAEFDGAILDGADLSDSKITDAKLDWGNPSGMKIYRATFREASMREAILNSVDFTRTNFSGADLSKAKMRVAKLESSNFSSANLSEADLYCSSVSNLRGAKLFRANLSGADLSGAILSNADMYKAKLSGAVLDKAHVEGADLRRADLNQAILREAYISEANLGGADLRGANLTGAYLDWANFDGADLRGANLSHAVVRETHFADIDLGVVTGLETIVHDGPSTIGIDTIYKSHGKISEAFLRGCGVPDEFIAYIGSLVESPIKYYKCFISYSTKDQEFAERLHADLQAKGVRCWFAPEEMKAGRKLHEQIDEAIRLHDKLLLILSEHSMNSTWVETEIGNARKREAQEKKQMLFPITLVPYAEVEKWKLFDADRGKDSAKEIREYFIPDFSNWKNHDSYQAAFQRLVSDLKAEASK